MDIHAFLDLLEKVRSSGQGWVSLCPGHEDKSPSLSIGIGDDGRILLHCHAGCPPEQIVAARGLTMADLMPPREEHRSGERPRIGESCNVGIVEAVYEYPDAAGVVNHLVARYRTPGGKTFRPFHLEAGAWKMGAGPDPWPLYMLPELHEAIAMERAVWLVEGEKCVDTLVAAGIPATTSHGGANGWRSAYAEELRGAELFISPDNDEPGEAYAAAVLASVQGIAESAHLVRLPGLEPHGDVADFLASGKTARDLEALAAEAARPQPPALTPGLWLSYSEVMAERRAVTGRYGLGLKGLDEKLEGGLFGGTITTIQGGPHTGKTALASQMATYLAEHGCHVACLFADEGNPNAGVTLGQQAIGHRHKLQDNDAAMVAEAEKFVPDFSRFRMLRPNHKAATLEQILSEFHNCWNGAQGVLLLDSAQTIRLAVMKPRESPVELVQRAVTILRDLILEYGLIVLLLSRVSRASSGARKEEDSIDPIAAAWGGAVEYVSDLIVHLANRATRDAPKVLAQVIKNRLSASGPFNWPLVLDWEHKRFMEIDPAAEEEEKHRVALEAVEKWIGRVLLHLASTSDFCLGTNQLRKLVGGRKATADAGRDMLLEKGWVVTLSKGQRLFWQLTGSGQEEAKARGYKLTGQATKASADAELFDEVEK
jgi:archaellum biogenesis ATPase FlaH